ncbi:hypothetical protein BDU57DRAFT_26104 [Ampelomyces quisqualis]|uniref:Protein SIP5 n=1 Tax=Ampelomyces quisqualis TaxID=50730 RepID=A0A6A5QYD6_AMPQU|nr:hypothetical protein BDU57DRAFT_26104 [Ampelomyces quisqualis]
MGNSHAKEAPPAARGHARRPSAQAPAPPPAAAPGGVYSARGGRGSTSFLGLGSSAEPRDAALEPRRETKAEREARKLEKERVARAQEREKSLREEGADGGFLVTLGVYTGPEDFGKPIVRQLQIERRLAPFWKGLDDWEDSWTEHQLVAVVNGKPLPAPDDIPPDEPPRPSNHLSPAWNPRTSETNLDHLTVPIGSRSMSQNSDRSGSLSPAHPAFSLPSPTSPIAANSSSTPFFRGRAKTLASLATGSRNASQSDMAPQELTLPQDPYVNGQRIEAFLYKNAQECPICFMFYPPYLNKTRCCDQPICSECFVQIKRPDPHTPEHHGDADSPDPPSEPQEDINLVSEPAACPFCVQPEFGVTYEPPPFRRGLVYNQQGSAMGSVASAMSSTSSLNSANVTSPGRRRATSLAVTDKTVVTTDMVRPDWAKKLSDARAHALRRAAAATALHNAAYMMGNIQQHESRFALSRRRRNMFGADSAGSSGQGTPRRDGEASTSQIGEASHDLFPGRGSSRRGNRLDDLEELMMMEAIRLSLAAEEERKRREEKDAAREAKKDTKKKAKELKKVAKAQSRIGSGFHPIEVDGVEDPQAGSSSAAGKGKQVDRAGGAGFNPTTEPTSTMNTSAAKEDSQKHLEESRAQIQRETSSGNLAPFDPSDPSDEHRVALRNLSNASSSASSFAESYQNSLRQGEQKNLAPDSSIEPSPSASGLNVDQTETPPQGTPGTEPMFNFQSLAEAIPLEEVSEKDAGPQFIENAGGTNESYSMPSSASTSESAQPRSSGLEDSTLTIKPTLAQASNNDDGDNEITPAPRVEAVQSEHSHLDQKHIGEVSMMDGVRHQATQ